MLGLHPTVRKEELRRFTSFYSTPYTIVEDKSFEIQSGKKTKIFIKVHYDRSKQTKQDTNHFHLSLRRNKKPQLGRKRFFYH